MRISLSLSNINRGYTAPEYAIHGQLSENVDTHGFGIVVLEIISGRRCNDVQSTNEYLLEDVSSYVITNIMDNIFLSIADMLYKIFIVIGKENVREQHVLRVNR